MDTRICPCCNEEKPLNNYTSTCNGKQKIHRLCTRCRDSARERYNRKKNIKAKQKRDLIISQPASDTKICATCMKEKPIDNFLDLNSGKERIGCAKCREYYRKLNASRKICLANVS